MKNNLLILPILLLLLLELYHFFHYPWVRKLLTGRCRRVKSATPKPRQLKPKTEKDCPQCRDGLSRGEPVTDTCLHVPKPWNSVKGKGGKKKTIHTQGYFCSNPACAYYLITDETIHALVGDGSHGKYEEIQDLLCQACHKKFTVRRHTVLYRLKTHSATVRLVLNLLALGTDISAIEEALNLRESTIRTWLCRSGEQGRKLHQRFLVNLELVHVQLDELWANVKQAQQDVWVWTVCDAKTKLIPVVQLGTRTQDMAYSVVHELKTRLAPGCVPVFSSDGLKHYFYALTAHFGEWFQPDDQPKPTWLLLASFAYAQVIKYQRRFQLIDVEQ